MKSIFSLGDYNVPIFISLKLFLKGPNNRKANIDWVIVFLAPRSYQNQYSWRRNQMEALSALLSLCEGNPSFTGRFPSQRPVTWTFDYSLWAFMFISEVFTPLYSSHVLNELTYRFLLIFLAMRAHLYDYEAYITAQRVLQSSWPRFLRIM